MMLSSQGLIDTMSGGPLCPQSLPPVHPSHALRVALADAAFEASPQIDGDYATRDVEAINTALHNAAGGSDGMSLYRDTVTALNTSGPTTVEALYFRCLTCGLILPAQRAAR